MGFNINDFKLFQSIEIRVSSSDTILSSNGYKSIWFKGTIINIVKEGLFLEVYNIADKNIETRSLSIIFVMFKELNVPGKIQIIHITDNFESNSTNLNLESLTKFRSYLEKGDPVSVIYNNNLYNDCEISEVYGSNLLGLKKTFDIKNFSYINNDDFMLKGIKQEHILPFF